MTGGWWVTSPTGSAVWPHLVGVLPPRRVPVHQDPGRPAGTVEYKTHYAAWQNYNRHHLGQSALRIAERGGFSYGEMQCALAGHYDRCAECRESHPPVPTWEPREPE